MGEGIKSAHTVTGTETKLSDGPGRRSGISLLFTATLFSSAFLMFMVQPMFAKMALPRLGGTSAVWSLALVFFQVVLLLGYSYAHLMVRRLSLKASVIVQVLLCTLALFNVPIAIAGGWDSPPESGQAFWLLGLFAASVGLPFFALSANAPLLQAWFARTGQLRSEDPYFLYAASNAGSFIALLAYPVAVEPFLGLLPQGRGWGIGFVVLIFLIGLCGTAAIRAENRTDAITPPGREKFGHTPWIERFWWVVYSALPSGLLVAVTAYITMDVVAAPFLWVVPLAIYLLTFVIAFQARPLIPHRMLLSGIGLYGSALAILSLLPLGLIYEIPLSLLLCFLLMLTCHGELAARRPPAVQLTEFYFFVSLGGVLGGIFASLVAPNIFNSVVEYPALIIATMAALGFVRRGSVGAGLKRQLLLGFVGAPLLLLMAFGFIHLGGLAKTAMIWAWVAVLLAWLTFGRRQPLALAFLLAGVIGSYLMAMDSGHVLARTRSFYGVLTVKEALDGRFHELIHGTTAHGWQTMRNKDGTPNTAPPQAEGYYSTRGPFGSAIGHFRGARADSAGRLDRVALVGMGIGSLLCYSRPGESWNFFEIDPQVVALASDPRFFTPLRDCGPAADITIGDGRLQLAHAADGTYDLIVLDAFSSDSIPAHLLTVDALELYMRKLKPDGIAIFHTSNRFMELSRVVEGAAARLGLEAWRSVHDEKTWGMDRDKGDVLSDVVVVAKSRGSVPGFAADPAWQPAKEQAGTAWTDDYSSIPRAIWRKFMAH